MREAKTVLFLSELISDMIFAVVMPLDMQETRTAAKIMICKNIPGSGSVKSQGRMMEASSITFSSFPFFPKNGRAKTMQKRKKYSGKRA